MIERTDIGAGKILSRAEDAGLPPVWIRLVMGLALLYLILSPRIEGMSVWHWLALLVAWDILEQRPKPPKDDAPQ